MNANVPATSPFGSNLSLRGGTAAMAQKLAQAGTTGALGTAPDGSEYLNFSGKRGVYEFGKDKEDIGADELWLINIEAFEEGYICWKGGRPIATRLANIYGDPVPAPDYNEHAPFKEGEGWFLAKSLICRSIDEGRQGYFKINSKSGVAVFAQLQEEVAARMNAGLPCWPLVQFDREKFQAQGNWNSKPVIRIYGWLSTEAIVALGQNPSADIDELIEMSESGAVTDPVDDAEEVEDAVEPEPAVAPRGARRAAAAAKAEPAPAVTGRKTRRGL